MTPEQSSKIILIFFAAMFFVLLLVYYLNEVEKYSTTHVVALPAEEKVLLCKMPKGIAHQVPPEDMKRYEEFLSE